MGNLSGMPSTSDYAPYIVNKTYLDPSLKGNSGLVSGFMFGSGVFGNTLALFVLFLSEPKQRRTVFYRLVAGLTITDLIGISLTSPFVTAVYANDGLWIGGRDLCNFFGFVMIFAGYATMLIICSMSIERVICVRYPYIHRTRIFGKHAIFILITCWFTAAFIGVLPFMGFGKIVLQYPYTWCFFDYYSVSPINKAFNYFFAIFAIVIIFVTACCNMTSLCTMLNKCRQKSDFCGKSGVSRKYCRSKRYNDCQMLVQLVGITLVFTSCYFPFMINIIVDQNEQLRDVHSDFTTIRLASVNQILDPWIYILLRRELVQKILFSLRNRFGKQNNHIVTRQKIMYETEKQTIFDFCFHCLCDSPVRLHSDSPISGSDLRLSALVINTTPFVRQV